MGLVRKSAKPVAITDASGQPHLELEIAGLKITAAPPKKREPRAEPDATAEGTDRAR